MKLRMAVPIALGTMALVYSGALHSVQAQTNGTGPDPSVGGSATPPLVLTPAQRRAIYAAASQDRSKTAKRQFPPTVGAEVPPMIELYALPDQVLAENRTANYYEYTLVQNKVVLVDPTKMRVIDVIGPNP